MTYMVFCMLENIFQAFFQSQIVVTTISDFSHQTRGIIVDLLHKSTYLSTKYAHCDQKILKKTTGHSVIFSNFQHCFRNVCMENIYFRQPDS